MSCKRKRHRVFAGSAFVLLCLVSVSLPAFAQDGAKVTRRWSPKDGLYADPGADLGERCMELTEVVIELADKSISGNEWNCKINKRTDIVPNTLRLDATCADLEEKPYKVVFLLKRIDDKTILYGASTKEKKDPGQPMSFCPEQGQRRYIEAKAKSKAEAEQKAAEERSKPATKK
jgi:hypothetical protein